MRLTILADNRTNDNALITEHGLCAFLDTGKIKVLLDTGASDVFLRNAYVLGIDLTDVDYVFISHGHGDHAGGLTHILGNNKKAQVILSSAALKGSFHSSRKGMHDITPDWPASMLDDRLIIVDEEMVIEGMRIIPHIVHRYAIPKADKCLFTRGEDGTFVQDTFRHEMALQIDDFLFTGCAHNGLMNIIESSTGPVHTVLGGFHLLDKTEYEEFENESEIDKIASDLFIKYPETSFYTGHCTGDKAFVQMKKVLGDNLKQFTCGMSIEI